ncbi:MAG: RagB/SusD family nutrient uptake outer membrane protein [Muribaculaceae bacterium]|nr:RagB/SusD family nutrient uptake outer membrane protein [Muribaculaceae bacterium]
MKTIYKSLIAAIVLMPTLSSCVEEVFPQGSTVTEGQLGESAEATESLVFGMTSYFNNIGILGRDLSYDWGYGSLMHMRDVMTEQMSIQESGYDWYSSWSQCTYIGPNYASTQFIWNFYTKLVLTTNNAIAAINPETATGQQLCYLGIAYAFRANHYLDMARMYEYLPTDVTSPITPEGNDVTYYTVPIVTQETTEEESRKNYRAKREDMYEFILEDLQHAEEYIQEGTVPSKNQPNLAVVYGLYARLFMWVEDYPNAAKYARLAIDNFSGYPTTQEQWLDLTTGFNSISTPSWMWGSSQIKEDSSVQSRYDNWTSWVSNEALFGYTGLEGGPIMMINKASYDRINNADFRKLSYIAPKGSELSGKEPVIDPSFRTSLPTYSSLKFRPAQGNVSDYLTGAASDYPLMRVEEMYFIEAEAVEHSNPGQGKALLESFMQTYRYSSYTCTSANVIEEIFFQKAIELWGEGQTYFDLKRLGYSVKRNYDGTNFYSLTAINTTGRPAWLNFCFVQTEPNNNEGLRGWNNPDPSDLYDTNL